MKDQIGYDKINSHIKPYKQELKRGSICLHKQMLLLR